MICIDTMVLIWGVQRNRNAVMVERTSRYLSYLEEENEIVMVPSVAVAEYLHGISADDQKQQLALLTQSFFVPSFDVQAASIAGEISSGEDYQTRFAGSNRQERNALRTDLQILATAIAYGASTIVTDNLKDYSPYAKDRIKVTKVPNVPQQLSL